MLKIKKTAKELLNKENLMRLLQQIDIEEHISNSYLHLTANENVMSDTARKCLSSKLSDRYHIGTSLDHLDNTPVTQFGNLSFIALNNLYELESDIRLISQKILHCALSDFRPLSGIHALMCTLISATKIGDCVFSIDPTDGGHFATTNLLNQLGRKSALMRFDSTLTIDISHFEELVKIHKPAAIIFDHSATLTEFPLKQIRNIAGEQVRIIFDASHTLGLIIGGCFQNPLSDGCDILQGNTHKTFPGPQKAMIHFRDLHLGKQVMTDIGKALVSSQHTHHTLALFVTMLEMSYFGPQYAQQMINNARALCKYLSDDGFDLVGVGEHHTNTNLVLIDLKDDYALRNACNRLSYAGIGTNARTIYNKNVLRIGTQELTRRGMKEEEMKKIADFFKRTLLIQENPTTVRTDVIALNDSFRSVLFSFDGETHDNK